jgi:demethylmenaquinone methyltransferase/2-methoxy-6-polyprenyl-1,4-benzoquinol methylase
MNVATEESKLSAPAPSRHEVWKMFDRIASRYDLLNHLLSFNRDKYWRKRVGQMMPNRLDLTALDLATGTGDQLVSLYQTGKISRGEGMDLSENMLAIGRTKIERLGLSNKLVLKTGDAGKIPAPDGSVDVITISFGIRNVTDVPSALREMHRVLRPGGRLLVLEFSLPKNGLLRTGYLFYFRHILPILGGLISGDSFAYRYLNKTVETFPYGQAFCTLMTDAGFNDVTAVPLTFGVASIYSGDKK